MTSDSPSSSPVASADLTADGPDQAHRDGEADEAGGGGPTLEEQVAEIVRIIRPAIQADQGDIFLRNVDAETGVVSVELVGACITCPASSQTLKEGLERILKQRVDGVTSVEHVGEELLGADEGTAVSL